MANSGLPVNRRRGEVRYSPAPRRGDGNDIIDGENGDDAISGGDGNDILRGSSGADTLTGGTGADSFSGGSGVDTAADRNPAQGDTQDGTIP